MSFDSSDPVAPPEPHAHHHRRHHGHGEHFLAGRKLSSADLQLVLLALLEDHVSHGYALIDALAERSGGFYAPSPGMIYPALTALDAAGLATAQMQGKRKCYALTQAGRDQLAAQRAQAGAILARLERIGRKMDRVRAAFEGQPDADARAEARFVAIGALKQALRHKQGCPPEEADRITAILKGATADILRQDE